MKLSAIAAALALSLPLTAFADVTSTAQVGNFHFDVIDLDLNDGITAALTLTDMGQIATAGFTYDYQIPPSPFEYRTEDGTVTVDVDGGSASGTLAGGTVSAQAAFHGPAGEIFGTAGVGYSFTLTANTQVIVYADAAVNGGASGGEWLPGWSVASLSAAYIDGNDEPILIGDGIGSYQGEGNIARQLSITFSSGATAIEGDLGYATGAYAGLAPVPEPSQWALLTAGLAGLGWRLRRAKRG